MNPLMDVSALNHRMTSGERTVLLDVRWALGDPHGREHYLAAHIPGAVYVDLPTKLAAPADPGQGRHPLPPLQQFQESARCWGIRDNDVVVAYDDTGSTAAARLWWMLRNAGLSTVFLLDGGLSAWRAAGYRRRRRPRAGFAGRRHADRRCDAGDRCSPGRGVARSAACCWTRGRGSATAARSSRSIRGQGTFPAL